MELIGILCDAHATCTDWSLTLAMHTHISLVILQYQQRKELPLASSQYWGTLLLHAKGEKWLRQEEIEVVRGGFDVLVFFKNVILMCFI